MDNRIRYFSFSGYLAAVVCKARVVAWQYDSDSVTRSVFSGMADHRHTIFGLVPAVREMRSIGSVGRLLLAASRNSSGMMLIYCC